MSPQRLDVQPHQVGTFPEHYRSAVLRVQAALTRILLSVGADPTKPQQLARRFGLNKNLAWMVSKMINTPDVYSVAPHIPGAARIDSLLSAMKRVGAAAEGLEELRSAVAAFDLMVTQHAGDRATLELMISELSSENVKGEQLLQSRKQAFCGLSGILGAQMRLRLMCYVLAPSAADPDLVDLVEVSGLFDFRRLRTDAR